MKSDFYEGVVVATVRYGADMFGLTIDKRRKLAVMKMKCLRNRCEVTMTDRWRIDEVRARLGETKTE